MCVPNKHEPITMLALFPKTPNNMDIHEWFISQLSRNAALQDATPPLSKPRKISIQIQNLSPETSWFQLNL